MWPGLILLSVKHFRDNISKALAVFTICSFAFSIYTVYGNAQFAFYFPLCRFWQIAIGGLLALNKSRLKDTSINNLLSGIGISAILITPFMISEDSLFPGWWSLSPSLGGSSCHKGRFPVDHQQISSFEQGVPLSRKDKLSDVSLALAPAGLRKITVFTRKQLRVLQTVNYDWNYNPVQCFNLLFCVKQA